MLEAHQLFDAFILQGKNAFDQGFGALTNITVFHFEENVFGAKKYFPQQVHFFQEKVFPVEKKYLLL